MQGRVQGRRLLAALSAAGVLMGAVPAIAAGPVYGPVRDVSDVDRIFEAIRVEVGQAQSRAELTRLYRRAGYLVTLTYSHAWRTRFGEALPRLRAEAKRQFKDTVRQINGRARTLGTVPDYDGHRGDG
jgi:hypothetical protein